MEEKKKSDDLLQNQIQKSTELESTIAQLKQQLETPTTDENELQTLKSKILELEQNISILETTNNDLKLANESIKKENGSLQKLEAKVEDILGQLKQKEDLLKQMESDQSTLKNQVEEKVIHTYLNLLNQSKSYLLLLLLLFSQIKSIIYKTKLNHINNKYPI